MCKTQKTKIHFWEVLQNEIKVYHSYEIEDSSVKMFILLKLINGSKAIQNKILRVFFSFTWENWQNESKVHMGKQMAKTAKKRLWGTTQSEEWHCML